MKTPSKKEISTFLEKEFPDIEFDGIKFEETKPGYCWFKIISYGRTIAQADYPLTSNYWNEVRKHLKWAFEY